MLYSHFDNHMNSSSSNMIMSNLLSEWIYAFNPIIKETHIESLASLVDDKSIERIYKRYKKIPSILKIAFIMAIHDIAKLGRLHKKSQDYIRRTIEIFDVTS